MRENTKESEKGKKSVDDVISTRNSLIFRVRTMVTIDHHVNHSTRKEKEREIRYEETRFEP